MNKSHSHDIRALQAGEKKALIESINGICSLPSCAERIAYEVSWEFQRASTGKMIKVKRNYCDGHASFWAARHSLTDKRIKSQREAAV